MSVSASRRPGERRIEAGEPGSGIGTADARRSRVAVAYASALVLTIATFYSGDYFFYWDEWDALHALAAAPVRKLLFVPHNEHLLPVHRLFFAATTSVFGERYFLHVLVNCALHAANACLLLQLLRERRVARMPAWTAAAAYLLAYAHWDNLGIAFQSQVLLGVMFALLAVRAGLRRADAMGRDVATAIVGSMLSAWSFGTGLVIAPLLALNAAVGAWSSRRGGERARWIGVAVLYGGVSAALSITYILATSAAGRPATEALGQLAADPAAVARLAHQTVTNAFGGGLFNLAAVRPGAQHVSAAFVASLVYLVLGYAICRRDEHRALFLKSVVYQVAVFGLIALARPGAEAGFADRYQSFGLIGVAVGLAVTANQLLAERTRTLQAAGVALLAFMSLGVAGNVRMAHAYRPINAERRGVIIRDDYYRLKNELCAHRTVFPDLLLSRHGHPGFPASRLVNVVAYLDPSVRPFLPSRFIPVRYYEQRANTRPWGHILREQGPVQTLVFDGPGWIEQVEFWFGSGGKRSVADCRITVLDGHDNVLGESRVAGRSILNNLWVACRMPRVAIAPGVEYKLRVRSDAEDESESCTVWMNADPESWPLGATAAPDGTVGDLCFSVAVSTGE